jgi:hypothetical protein
MPQHLKSAMGQTYMRSVKGSKIADESFHFDPYYPYMDYTNVDESKKFKDGTRPGKILFEYGWTYNETARTFRGKITFN